MPPAFDDVRVVPALRLGAGRWCAIAAALAVGVIAATVVSHQVALPVTLITPIFLPLGVGVAVLARWGRSLWPAFVAADLVGQLLSEERLVTWIALSLACHLLIALVGATAVRRRGAWVGTLGGTARYLVIAALLALLGGTLGIAGLWVHGFLAGPADALQVLVFWVLGDLGGYVVAGAAILAWSDGGARADLRRTAGWIGLAAVAAVAGAAAALGDPWLGAGALVVAGLVAARGGTRWGTAAMALVLAGVLWTAVHGVAPFGGPTPADQAFNAMLATLIFAGGALLLGGYRAGSAAAGAGATVTTAVLVAAVAVMGLADFSLAQISTALDAPIALTALVFAGSLTGIVLVRVARPSARPTDRRALLLAGLGGLLDAGSKIAFFAALPELGTGPASALYTAYPVPVILLAALLARRLPPPALLAVGATIAAGVAVITASSGGSGAMVAIATSSAVLFGGAILLLNAALGTGDTIDVTLTAIAVAGVAAAAVALFVEGPAAFAVSPSSVGVVVIAAVGGSLVPMIARAWSLPSLGPAVVAGVGALGLVLTAVLGLAVHTEDASAAVLIGLVLIGTGGVLAAVLPNRAA